MPLKPMLQIRRLFRFNRIIVEKCIIGNQVLIFSLALHSSAVGYLVELFTFSGVIHTVVWFGASVRYGNITTNSTSRSESTFACVPYKWRSFRICSQPTSFFSISKNIYIYKTKKKLVLDTSLVPVTPLIIDTLFVLNILYLFLVPFLLLATTWYDYFCYY